MDSKKTKGFVFDVMRYAIHDGPGIRTTVFLKGCPLHCIWCANPESQRQLPEISHITEACVLCGKCEAVCPHNAIRVTKKEHHINRCLCDACGICVSTCPVGALEIFGREVTVEQIVKEIEGDRIFWERSKGGVTLSGGEPFMQPYFCRDLLEAFKKRYISTIIETCLYVSKRQLDFMLPFVDLFICDFKVPGAVKHKKFTGVDNKCIKQNLKYLIKEKRKECLIRMPLIPGCNDDNQQLQAVAAFLNSLDNVQLEIMPYHRLGEPKYKRLGRYYKLKCKTPSKNDIKKAKRLFASENINVIE